MGGHRRAVEPDDGSAERGALSGKTDLYHEQRYFFLGDEGIFFDTVPEHDNPLHDIYSEIFYPEGKYFALYCEFAQVIWMQILLGIVFLFLDLRRETYRKALLMIVLCGLLVFLMLFEARARYLILYSPAFLILSLHGYEGLFSRIYGKVKKTKPTQ